MKTDARDREIRFFVQDDCLVRSVTGTGIRSYVHRCSKKAYEAVAYVIDCSGNPSLPTCAIALLLLAQMNGVPRVSSRSRATVNIKTIAAIGVAVLVAGLPGMGGPAYAAE